MIGKLTGLLDSVDGDIVLLDVNGVGYVAQCGSRTLGQLPAPGGRVSLLIETQMSAEQIRLFGFGSAEERDWFRLLQSVQGVGAKVALAILGALSPGELGRAIALGDKAAVSRANGVGPKLAQRICLELKDKVPAMMSADVIPLPTAKGGRIAGATGEALSALVNLGYQQSEAAAAVAAGVAAHGEAAGVEVLIRHGLKELARG
jgi:holliday junction DNA helicase RuvA